MGTEASDLLADMLDEAPGSITVHDSKGTFLYANRRTFELHGYTQEEFMALTLPDVDVPQSRELMAERMRLIEERGEATFEVGHYRKDGTILPLEVYAKRAMWGEVPVFLSIATDLTAKKRAEAELQVAEQALRRERDNLRATMASAPVAILVIDPTERVVLANPAAQRFFGSPPGEGEPSSCGDLLGCARRHDDPRGCGASVHCTTCGLMEGIRRVLRGEDGVRDQELEIMVETSDGVQKRHLVANIEGLQEGPERRAVAALHDITARKAADERSTRLERELLHSRKMEAIGQLAGGVAHDFNNLLTIITSYAELVQVALPEGAPIREDLEQILQAGSRAAALTRQLLAFGRRQVLSLKAVSLNRVTRNLETMLRRLLGENIEIQVRTDETLGTVLADPGQIELVLLNLSVNARDAMPHGGALTLETRRLEQDDLLDEAHVGIPRGSYALLSVSDTGVGMDVETQRRIFDPFFTTKEVGKGTGLGLSTVHGIITQTGGYLRVLSAPGEGTTFSVYLPSTDIPLAQAHPGPHPGASMGTETVLVVEDEDEVRRLVRRLLGAAGYRVILASNGPEALLLFAAHREEIRLLLTDVIMPGMSGKQLAEHLLELRPDLKVIYMSGYTDNAIAQHGVLGPGTRFLGKPFSQERLTRAVRDALDD